MCPTMRAPRPRSYPRDARSRSFRYQPGRRASCSAAKEPASLQIFAGKTNLRRPKICRGLLTFTTPPADVTLSTRASVMAPFRKPRAQSSAVCLLLGAVAAVLGIIGLAAHHTHQQAASHHDVIHHFHSSSSRLDVGSDTPVKLGGGNRAGRVSQHLKADRFRSHVRARVDAHKNADGDNLDDLRSADETIRSSIPVKTIREDATSTRSRSLTSAVNPTPTPSIGAMSSRRVLLG